MDELLAAKSPPPIEPTELVRFETKDQLLESLVKQGYIVDGKAKIRGKSGLEYAFDILAHTDINRLGHSLGIDFLTMGKEVDIEQLALFDAKAYDTGIDDKAVVVRPGLSSEARQFAGEQGIRVIELGQKPAAEPSVRREMPARTGDTPAKKKIARLMPQPEALRLIPEVTARRYNAVPLSISGNTLQVAMADPTDIFALEAFAAQSRMRIAPIDAGAQAVREAIDFNYKGYGEIEKQISHISVSDEAADEGMVIDGAIDAPLVQGLNLIIEEAVKARSSDIHIEPEEDRVRIRYRIDGTLQDILSLPANIHRPLISRLKILAELNIADRYRPQDGQFSFNAKGRQIDVRVATVPTVAGEMASLRILDKAMAAKELSGLGLFPDSLAKLEDMLKVPHGLILISGPTGAGKTTTLYAAINSLDTMGRNIITIEDPAEYRFKDINQIQVNPQAGITFASGLRAILRLDPDIIMVGEIRDGETANIATQAALTGHLVLASIHANDSAGVLSRLLDLGVEPFLVASSIIGIIAQRMVRRICPDCCRFIEAPLVERVVYKKEMGEERTEFLYGTGCKACIYTGYLGRTGLHEVLAVSDSVKMMVANRASSSDIRAQALQAGMISMMKDGMRKVEAGITTPAEVLRSAYSPDWQMA